MRRSGSGRPGQAGQPGGMPADSSQGQAGRGAVPQRQQLPQRGIRAQLTPAAGVGIQQPGNPFRDGADFEVGVERTRRGSPRIVPRLTGPGETVAAAANGWPRPRPLCSLSASPGVAVHVVRCTSVTRCHHGAQDTRRRRAGLVPLQEVADPVADSLSARVGASGAGRGMPARPPAAPSAVPKTFCGMPDLVAQVHGELLSSVVRLFSL